MVNAGRVAPLPRGAWNGTTTYAMLDIVTYNDVAWIAKRESLGQTPADNAYWQRFGSSAPIATTSTAGIVIPDGTTIAVAQDGTISVVAKLGDLANVELTDLASGQVIAYNATTQKWINVDISTTLAGLEDVDLTGVQDGQIIAYNATTRKWEPIDPPSSQKSEILIDYDPAEMTGITVTLAHAASAEGHTPESYQVTLDNTGEVEQDVINLGLWTITWTHEGQSYSEEFDVHYYGYFHVMLHEGFTWRLWATAGGIPINQYDSLSQLLADEAAVRRLFIVHNAVDYMCENANSTQNQDLITIINNGLCAKWANLSDYALDKMEANAVLSDLMDDADLYGYGELIEDNGSYVPKGNVPVMTSNTAPYGEVIYSSVASQSYVLSYGPFDSRTWTDDTKMFASNETAVGDWFGYKFTNPVCIRGFKARINLNRLADYKIEGSNDGSTWTTVYSGTNSVAGDVAGDIDAEFSNNSYYLYWRIYRVSANASTTRLTILKFQFYGRELKVSVPTMTSNTAPYGEVIWEGTPYEGASGVWMPYQCFDSSNTRVCEISTGARRAVGYNFGSKVRVEMFSYAWNSSQTDGHSVQTFKLLGSDGDAWTELTDTLQAVTTPSTSKMYKVENDSGYLRYELIAESWTTAGSGEAHFGKIQFYGKDYSEKEFANDGSKWLYDHGVELEEFTGSGSGVTQKESDSLYCEVSIANVGAVFSSDNIDLTSYNLLRFKLGNTLYAGGNATSYGQMRVQSRDTIVSSKELLTTGQNYPNNEFLDIVSVNQSCTIRPLTVNGSSAISRKITFTELWLE